MLAGHTPVESALEMGVTIHTVRTYLKRLYLKTGVRTQASLVRKLVHCAQIPYPRC
jgi:DNA-binding CsgD family transcriptional regulator